MKSTKGILERIRNHDKVGIALNENCKITLPDDIMRILTGPHQLSFYYFQYIEKGTATGKSDLSEFTVNDGQLAFGFPNQVFTKLPYNKKNQQYALSFDEQTLSLLPGPYPFLVNPYHVNIINFDVPARQRVKNLHAGLFHLLHSSPRQKKADIILAHLHTLLTEFNTAYFEQYHSKEESMDTKLSKYIEFKLAVERNLSDQHDVKTIAEKLALHSSTLYNIVKENSGISPKEWITSRLMMEAQRKLQYTNISVKELAYELGFNDPGYFSRLFKKNTGKTVSQYLADRDLSYN